MYQGKSKNQKAEVKAGIIATGFGFAFLLFTYDMARLLYLNT